MAENRIIGRDYEQHILQNICEEEEARRVVEMILFPSLSVGFNPTILALARANAFVLHSLNRKVPLVFLWSPYGVSEAPRRCHRGCMEVYASGNVSSNVYETGFVTSCNFVQTLPYYLKVCGN